MIDWLTSELKAVVISQNISRFALDLSQEKVVLLERSGGETMMRGSAVHEAPDFEEKIAEMRQRVVRAAGKKAPVDLLLPDPLIMHRTDTFPADAREDLREAAWWRLDTLTRLKPEELSFDVVLRDQDPSTGFLELGIAVASKEMVEEAIDYARKWGFEPLRVTASSPIEGFPNGPTFALLENHGEATRSHKRAASILLAATIVLAMVGVTRGILEREAIVDATAQKRALAETRLQEAITAREATLAFAAEVETPGERRASQPLAVEWLGALARSLPPSAYVERIAFSDGVIRIEGVAVNANAVLAAVESAPEFETARYAAAVVTPKSGVTLQNFAIEANIVNRETGA